MSERGPNFYLWWIAANGWAEAAGLGTTLLLGRAAAPLLEPGPSPGVILLAAGAAVVLGVLFEGVLVGIAQGRVLRGALPGLPLRSWIAATAAGAGLAWLLGMVPSTAMALLRAGAPQTAMPPTEPPPLAQYILALLLGGVTGPLLGIGQWLVLRRHVARAGRWIAANAAAWALGMAVIFAGMDLVPWNRGGWRLVLGVYLVCLAAGLVVGAVHGRVLRQLLANRLLPRADPRQS